MAVYYFEEGVTSGLKQKRKLSAFLRQTILSYLPVQDINLYYIFCTDEYLLEKNKTFLNHDTLTDVITFDLSENSKELQAEIYISVDRVKENAAEFKVPVNEELHRVIFHGMLHLCGFGDKTKKDQLEMRQKEQACLMQYFHNEI